MKFKSFVSSWDFGQVGELLQLTEAHRSESALVKDFEGYEPRPVVAASQLYHALVSTCEGLALRLVKKAGDGEGFEAWRLLLGRFDPINTQSLVMSLSRALRWELGTKDPFEGLETFEKYVRD